MISTSFNIVLTSKKRDQRAYDLVQKHLYLLIPETVLQVVQDMDVPYMVGAGLGGMSAYPPKIMAVICIIMEAERKTYRKMSGHLLANPELVAKLGLNTVPSKSTIARSYGLIPESYLYEVHKRVIACLTAGHSLAADSTGYSENATSKWRDVRTDKTYSKKKWKKLHAIIDVAARVMVTFLVTNGTAADINGFRKMLEMFDFETKKGTNFCLDSAYLAREICSIISSMEMTPFIKPKSNTTHNARGSTAWAKMVRMYEDNKEAFDAEYHQRSIIEAIFGAIKTMYGASLRCRREDNQRREIAIRIICYYTELVARWQVKSGILTHQSIRTAPTILC